MKIGKYIGLTIFSIGFTLGFSSCESFFDIKPESELILDDYWQDESDVESAVAACYRGMAETGFMERVIVWSELRSDNVIRGTSSSTNVANILNLSLDYSNDYTSWGSFYSVINMCNNVLHYAPGVKERDPDFTQGELRSYIAEVKGIRALCYFYLIRTFNNVPYITEPYIDDNQDFEMSQTNGTIVVDSLITDLRSIENNYAKSVYTTTQYTKGRITQKTIWTILADLCLWKEDYGSCVDYCNKILNAKTNPLTLVNSQEYNQSVFITGNSTESIFELQFSSDNPNYVVNEMYGTSGGRSGYNTNQLSAYDFTSGSLFNSSDIRGKDAFYPTSSGSYLPIKKYIAYRTNNNSTTVSASDYVNGSGYSNWIFYRLSDVYLMKAEALVEIGGNANLEEAINMVSKTYDRAHPSLESETLQLSDYSTQSAMRKLVLDERQREFLFEGKRYYDLLRLARREGTPNNIISDYLLNKYSNLDQSTTISKLNNMNALYMPINKNEMKVNSLLVQNPFYTTSSDVTSNK